MPEEFAGLCYTVAIGDRSFLCVLPLVFLGIFEVLNCYESKIGHSG